VTSDERRVLIIVPAYNEEAALRLTLPELRAVAPQFDVVVINDGSADATSEVAQGLGYPVLDLCFNVGIGGAVQTGFKYAVQVDSDGQFPPDQIEGLVRLVLDEGWDMVIGSRYLAEPGYAGSPLRRLGNLILSWFCTLFSGYKITDSTSGFRAYSRRALEYLAVYYPPDYPEPESIVFLARQGLRIREEPVAMRQRKAGASSIGGLKPLTYMSKVSLALTLNLLKEKPPVGNERRRTQ
jgi:glycosyltransferase involved in cell wall biosynthesis